MFAIPPPPRYPATNGISSNMVETVNVLSQLEGLEYRFQVGEGTYVLRDDLQLATPPPHPSETPVANPNPLATTTVPPTSGVKLSMLTLNPQNVKPHIYKTSATSSLLRWRTIGKQDTKSQKEAIVEKEKEITTDAASDKSVTPASTVSVSNNSVGIPVFGESNVFLTPVTTRDNLKRRKPKNNIVKSNSSFVSRVIVHDSFMKRLADRDQGGSFAFMNINRAFQWLDISSGSKSEPLAKILFTKAHMLCHDINQLTKDTSHIDVIMGSSASDIIWWEPISQKYARINKNGIINSSPVQKIKWIPGSENLFLAAHMDGSLVVYDKEKEDAPFVSEEMFEEAVNIEDDQNFTLSIAKSVNSTNQKANPVACWKVSHQPITDLAFSPDGRHLAVVGEDGYLRVVDYLQERMTDLYQSYYGGFTCVCWSPDGKYFLTGGQDDLVSIWSLDERQLVARCPGHDSWVTAVAFDPWRCHDKTYRFGSVGDDCKLLLWDFSVGMLGRPKAAMGRTRGSISTQSISLLRHRTESTSAVNRIRSDSNRSQSFQEGPEDDSEFHSHPVEPRARTAQLPPVMSKMIDGHPLSGIVFEQDCIITSCTDGHVRTWDRPREGANSSQINLVAFKDTT